MKNSVLILLVLVCFSLFGQTANGDEPQEVSKLVLLSWCLIGCILQEVIYWFELRQEIASGTIPSVSKSKVYWIITILAIIVFTGGSFLYFSYGQGGTPNFFTTAVFAAGFPRLFKGAVSTIQIPNAGSDTQRKIEGKFALKDYLMIKK